jgi:hypothetical protein
MRGGQITRCGAPELQAIVTAHEHIGAGTEEAERIEAIRNNAFVNEYAVCPECEAATHWRDTIVWFSKGGGRDVCPFCLVAAVRRGEAVVVNLNVVEEVIEELLEEVDDG